MGGKKYVFLIYLTNIGVVLVKHFAQVTGRWEHFHFCSPDSMIVFNYSTCITVLFYIFIFAV